MKEKKCKILLLYWVIALMLSILFILILTPLEAKAQTFPNVKFVPPYIDIYANNQKTYTLWTYSNGSIYYDFDNDQESIWNFDYIEVEMYNGLARNRRFTYLQFGKENEFTRIDLDTLSLANSRIYITRDTYGPNDKYTRFYLEYETKGLNNTTQDMLYTLMLPVDSSIRLIDNDYNSIEYQQGFEAGKNLFNERDYWVGFQDAFFELHEKGFDGFYFADGYTDLNSYSYQEAYLLGYRVGLGEGSFNWWQLLITAFTIPWTIMSIELLPGLYIGYFALLTLSIGTITFLLSLRGKK